MVQRTEEQQQCIDAAKNHGQNVGINAYAGTGKTTTCRLLSEEVRMPMVYLCFNKSIAEEAKTKFPEHVLCSTQHSYAYRAVGPTFNYNSNKLTKSMYARETADVLGIKPVGVYMGTHTVEASTLAYCVNQTVRRFCQSGDDCVQTRHYVGLDAFEGYERNDQDVLRALVVGYADKLWNMMIDKTSPVPLGFDGYLKYWALGNPYINTSKILLDEAQDTNGVMLSVLQAQQGKADVIFVGDKYQQIYDWRGAINAMDRFQNAQVCRLTQSFRFGAGIAEAASRILVRLNESVPVRGNPAQTSSFTQGDTASVLLTRTNATILDYLVNAYLAEENDQRIYVAGGVADLIALVDAGWNVQQGKKTSHPLFMGFKDWNEFVTYCEKTKDAEANALLRIFDKHGPVKAKRSLEQVVRSEHEADIVLTTAHKSKGREWQQVQLADDFRLDADEDGMINPAELRLLYVAITRGIELTTVPESIYQLVME